eukprot:678768_1
MSNHFGFVIFFAHIICVWRITCQYTTIWYDNMSQNNGWSGSGWVSYGIDSDSCTTNPCTKLTYDSDTLAWIRRQTSVSSYSTLQLRYDVSTRGVDGGDECRVYYSYSSSSTSSRVKVAGTSSPSSDRYWYPDRSITLPSAAAANTVWIWLEAWSDSGSSQDKCYFDDVYLMGIPGASPTNKPTPNPTKRPTPNPTKRPTPNPTKRPTPNPTKRPTPNPTKKPTPNPTRRPTPNPTPNPTPRPTDPRPLTCGDSVGGSYHGMPVTFIVHMAFEGDLEFNAAPSSFVVTDIEAFTKLNTVLGSDTDEDEVVTLYDKPAGQYKFVILGDQATSGTFEVRITCTSAEPSVSPTSKPTPIPTPVPTKKPVLVTIPTSPPTPTVRPTVKPTPNPTKRPTLNPTFNPTMKPTTPAPIQPDDLACGTFSVGTYSGVPVRFTVTIPFPGHLTFDATGSNFDVTTIEAYTQLGTMLSSDTDHDEQITLSVPAGVYQFAIAGSAQTSIYHVTATCVSAANPTISPITLDPTGNPSKRPTPNPTPSPSLGPTISGTLSCGERTTGTFLGAPVTFYVQIPFQGNLVFDASHSAFTVTDIEAYSKLNVQLGLDDDKDQIITLTDVMSGVYQFVINGETATSNYDIEISCSSDMPTASPTHRPTNHLECDDDITGNYNDETLTFVVQTTYDGSVTFDASESDFNIAFIEGLSESDEVLGHDSDHDKRLTLSNVKEGIYQFKMFAEGGTFGIFNVKIQCQRDTASRPTIRPTLTGVATDTTQQYKRGNLKGGDKGTYGQIQTRLNGIFGKDAMYIVASVLVLLICCLCCCLVAYMVDENRKKRKSTAAYMVDGPHNEDTTHVHMAPPPPPNMQMIQPDESSSDEHANSFQQRQQFGNAMVAEWLENHVNLPQYLSMFVNNGFDSLNIIAQIQHERELKEIGIWIKGHQTVIMAEIQKLKLQDDDLINGAFNNKTTKAPEPGNSAPNREEGRGRRVFESEGVQVMHDDGTHVNQNTHYHMNQLMQNNEDGNQMMPTSLSTDYYANYAPDYGISTNEAPAFTADHEISSDDDEDEEYNQMYTIDAPPRGKKGRKKVTYQSSKHNPNRPYAKNKFLNVNHQKKLPKNPRTKATNYSNPNRVQHNAFNANPNRGNVNNRFNANYNQNAGRSNVNHSNSNYNHGDNNAAKSNVNNLISRFNHI